jgi:hypothetical protein
MGPILDALRELGGSGKPREVLDLVADRGGNHVKLPRLTQVGITNQGIVRCRLYHQNPPLTRVGMYNNLCCAQHKPPYVAL